MGYHSGNVDYINHWGDHMKHDWWHGRKETPEKGYTTHLINKYALEFLEQNKDKPFCLYVAHESPHSPVQGPNDPIQRGPGARKRTTPYAEAMKQMILEMDKGVEQVRAKLVELGLEKNTLFLFFSDNGDAPRTNTGHPSHRGHKGSVYEGGTRVPAIAWWPGRIKPGTSTDALSITLDVMPTILSVAGIEKPKNRVLDGVDLSPVLFEQKTLPARPLYWGSLSNNGARSEALRDGNWKLVVQHPKAKPGTPTRSSCSAWTRTWARKTTWPKRNRSGPPPCSSNSRHGTPKPRKPPLTNRAAGCRGLNATFPSSTART